MKDKTCIVPIFCVLICPVLSFSFSIYFWFGVCTGKSLTMNCSYNMSAYCYNLNNSILDYGRVHILGFQNAVAVLHL